MFYSQFILAKKGPLGTIWIAAHLERKLRKNQVSDTDIGESVDSILFPEVPIALRLSSHLLLGVVRIYSRKVNYLFNDCSEALLKIKQAFRSTAVDLPPEESTAPYHSITLPETFDLDDFELPDSAFLQGNFVDHHISTREQITLQDSMDGTGYSTSQFRLDETFGDGDASQIRLDFDEDVFMDKNASLQFASVPLGSEEGEMHHGQSSISVTNMDIDEGQNEGHEHRGLEPPKDLSAFLANDPEKHVLSSTEHLKRKYAPSCQHGYNIQTPDLNEVFSPDDSVGGPSAVPEHTTLVADEARLPDLSECAQAPSTPGLMEEAIPASVHEIPAMSPQEKISSSNDVGIISDDTFITHFELATPYASNQNGLMHGVTTDPKLADNVQAPPTSTSALTESNVDLVAQSSNVILAAPCEAHQEHVQKRTDPKLADNVQAPPTSTSALTESDLVDLVAQSSNVILAAPCEAHQEHVQKRGDNLQSGFFFREVDNLPTVQDDIEAHQEHVQKSGDNLQNGFFVSEVDNLPTVQDNVEEMHRKLGHKSEDNLRNAFLRNEVSNLPFMQNNNGCIQPEVSCSDGLATPSCCEASHLETPINKPLNLPTVQDNVEEMHRELGHKSEDNLRNAFLCSEVNNLPFMQNNIGCIQPEVFCSDGLVTPCCYEASHLEISINKPLNDSEVVATSNDNVLVPGVATEMKSSSHEKKAEPSILSIQDHIEDVGSCLTSNRSFLSSNVHLGSCNSQSNRPNMLFSLEGALIKNTPEFSHIEPNSSSGTIFRDESRHASGPLIELQGTGNLTANTLESSLSGFKSGFNNPYELSTGLLAKHINLDRLNCSSSLECTVPPEKMLLAPSGNIKLASDLGKVTADRVLTESAVSVDRTNNLFGTRHYPMDSTPVLQNGSSAQLSGSRRLKRNNVFIPDDDDLLASILVGRTPSLRMGQTPVSPKVVSRKRPRMMQRAGVLKRKLPLDDTMILHADAIRQQLINVEDIRRVRKKAPCTRPDIWIIQKCSMEEELFSESILTGLSADLDSLHVRRYQMNGNLGLQIDAGEHHSYGKLSKEMDHSLNCHIAKEGPVKGTGEPTAVMSDKIDAGIPGPLGKSVSIEVQSCNDVIDFNAQEKLESCSTQVELPSNNQSNTVSTVDITVHEDVGFAMPFISAPHPVSEHEISTDSRIEQSPILKENKIDLSLEKSAICTHQELGSVHDLIQPFEKITEINDGTLNFSGGASEAIEKITEINDGTLNFFGGASEAIASTEDATRYKIDLSLEKSAICMHQQLGSVHDLIQPFEKITEINDGTLNFSGGASETIASAEDATKYKIDLSLEKSAICMHQELGSVHDLIQPSEKITEINDGTLNFSGGASEAIASSEDDTKYKIDLSLEKSAICMHQELGSVHDLIQPSEKTTEINDGTLNFSGGAPETIASAEDATKCKIVDVMDLEATTDFNFVQPEATCTYKCQSAEEEGNTDVVNPNCPHFVHADVCNIENGEILVSMLDNLILEERAGLPEDSSSVVAHASSPVPDIVIKSCESSDLATITMHQDMEKTKERNLEVAVESELVAEGELPDEERLQVDSLYPQQPIVETGKVTSTVGENSGLQENKLEGGLDVESAHMAREFSDFCNAIDGNDTEFLNAEEAELDEGEANEAPNPEAAQALENSRWSSRTRGVARYLKALFNEESGRGRKIVVMDHLLAGKTRKEASRMFFETLVLKTRDYVHVEQENPCDCINIKPRAKLLKSEF